MALSATLLFYFQYNKSGAGVTGKSGSITVTVKKLTRSSTPTVTTVTTGGAITVGSVGEVDSTNNKGCYVVGVSGLDPASDYLATAHYTGTSSDVDNVDVSSLQSEFSASINAGALPQAVAGAAGGLLIAGSNAATTFATLTVTGAFSINSVSNVAQTGDSFARIGAAGASLTALGDTRIAHLDADVSSRMATYSQPTGFLAATFPTTVASTTNITAGTIATVSGNVNGSVGSISGITFPTNFSVLSISATTGLVTLAGTQTFNNTGTWTGNVSGNVTGSVNSVTTGVTLAAAAVQAIWDALTSALTTTGSIGKSLVTFLGNFANMISGTGTSTPEFTEDALSHAPGAGSAPSVDEIADRLLLTPANKLATDSDGFVTFNNSIGGVAGSGADPVTLTILRTGTEIPIADADVWITSDSAGSTVVAGTDQTDSDGDVTFMLDDGATYYLWMQKDGETSIRGQSFVAEAD